MVRVAPVIEKLNTWCTCLSLCQTVQTVPRGLGWQVASGIWQTPGWWSVLLYKSWPWLRSPPAPSSHCPTSDWGSRAQGAMFVIVNVPAWWCQQVRLSGMSLLEFTANFGELNQAGLHGQRQLAGRDHQATVLVRVVRHRDAQSPESRQFACVAVDANACDACKEPSRRICKRQTDLMYTNAVLMSVKMLNCWLNSNRGHHVNQHIYFCFSIALCRTVCSSNTH